MVCRADRGHTMKQKKTEWLILIFAALPALLVLALLPALPAQVPVHWNLSGQPDSYGSPLLLLGIAAAGLILAVLLRVTPRLDPQRQNYEKFSCGYTAFRLAFSAFWLLMVGVVVCESLAPGTMRVGTVISAGVGVLFCVIGNFMPKFRHNYFVGIRTPWTLASESCWRATHRFAGPVWFWGGLVLAVGSFLLPDDALASLAGVLLAALAAAPLVYSYWNYKKDGKR